MPQLIEGGSSDGQRCTLRHAARVGNRIVMHNHHPIARRVHVELHGFCPQLERALEGRNSVFRQGVVGAAVGDPERWGTAVGQRYSWYERGRGEPMRRYLSGQSPLTGPSVARLPGEAE